MPHSPLADGGGDEPPAGSLPPDFVWWRQQLRRQLALSGAQAGFEPGHDARRPHRDAPRPLPRPLSEDVRRYRRVYAERFAAETLCDRPRGLLGLSDALVAKVAGVADAEPAAAAELAWDDVSPAARRVLPDEMSTGELNAALLHVDAVSNVLRSRRAGPTRPPAPSSREPQRAALSAIVRRFAPHRLPEIDSLMRAYRGNTAGLFADLRAQFGTAPERQERYRAALLELLSGFAPEKLDEVDALLLLHEGREGWLLQSLSDWCGAGTQPSVPATTDETEPSLLYQPVDVSPAAFGAAAVVCAGAALVDHPPAPPTPRTPRLPSSHKGSRVSATSSATGETVQQMQSGGSSSSGPAVTVPGP